MSDEFENMLSLGSTGLQGYQGFIEEAYTASLYWAGVYPLYNRIRRSDPEITMVRNGFSYLGRGVAIDWDMPDNPTEDDKKAAEFAESVLTDIDGGFYSFIEKLVTQAPFMGWASWNTIWGRRLKGWSVGGWSSQYNDGLIGLRKLAWRDQSSFLKWKENGEGNYTGWIQRTANAKETFLPFSDLLHITFGDNDNPEGLSPLEAVYRLERIKYGLEVIQGIGFEHAAGYLNVDVEENPITDESKIAIKQAAKNIATAKQGNYAAFPKNVTGSMVDVSFSVAPSILEAIKYYGILKLTIYNMQWVALSATSGSGSYSAMSDSSSMYIQGWNGMLDGFADQINSQLIKRLFAFPVNKNAFPNMTRLPRLEFEPIEKTLSLADLSNFVSGISSTVPLGEDDFIAIREKSGFLPTSLPKDGKIVNTFDTPQLSEFADAGDFDSIRADYEQDIKDAIAEYKEDGDNEQFKKAMEAAIVVAFLLAIRNAYASAGAGAPTSDTMAWMRAAQLAEVARIDNLIEAIKNGTDTERVGMWVTTLQSMRNEALLRAEPDRFLTFAGLDGKESCRTCQTLKGRRARASWWVSKDLIPARNGNDKFECGGWNCQHYLEDDDGNRVTFS